MASGLLGWQAMFAAFVCWTTRLMTVAAAPPSVHSDAVYGVNLTTGISYGKALYCDAANFSQTNCSTIELLLDVMLPVLNTSLGVPVPSTARPVILGIHGGSYSHGDSSEERANVEYFVQRGWVGFSINYRVCNQKPYYPPEAPPEAASSGNLICSQFGSFPVKPPFGNASCDHTKSIFGLGTADGCPLSSPPKLAANSTGKGRPGSFFGTLMAWMYPAMRDAKASVRWIRANAREYNVDSDFITAIGGSAGACSVVGLATVFEEDFKNELTAADDPTLASTNLEYNSSIATGLVQWGGEYVPLYARLRDPSNRSRYSKANAPLSTYHGSEDGVISIAEEDGLIRGYTESGVLYEQHELMGWGHGADAAAVNDASTGFKNVSQHAVQWAFVVKTQGLAVH